MTEISILSEHQCQLGEGPYFCQRRNTLFWFDILARKRLAHDFSTNHQAILNLTEMASAMASVDGHCDLIFTSSGLWLHDLQSGAWSPVASIEADKAETRSNDARVHKSGAFWLGTMGRNAEEKAGAIYHYRRGVLTVLFDDITIPNGMCFSPDGSTAYFTDTPTEKLMRVSVDPDTGLPTALPEVFIDHTGQNGGLDGAIVDADGNIWVALWGASAINCYLPNGKLAREFSMPAKQCTCSAFVTDGTIAVTSAWQGLDDGAKALDAKAGMTFLLATNVKPKFEPRVQI